MASRVESSGGDLTANLRQSHGRIVKAINDSMQMEMLKVRDVARLRAPLDEGNLTAAIKLVSEDRRRSWTVYVDESMPDDTGKHTVGDYATRMHESTYTLGPKSAAKAASNPSEGRPVGRKFLEGAFEWAIQNGMVERIAAFARTYGIGR